MTHFLFRAELRGGHVHVGVWGGTEQQAANQARPKLGTLVMDPEQWGELRSQLAFNQRPGPACHFDIEGFVP